MRFGRRAAAPPRDWSARELPADPALGQPVTERLLARLGPEHAEALEAALRTDPDAWTLWTEAAAPLRNMLQLSFGLYLGIPGVAERTGLTPDDPPDHVHAMARGAAAAGGDFASADLVVESLERAGGAIGAVRRALDLGCSSGRTLRPLAAAYPEVEWHGADPNGPAVEWAAAHVPRVAFAHSPTEPPLAYDDAAFDLAYAISIWSHFAEAAALRWLEEMHRVVAPRGHLVLTFHSAQSVAFYGALGLRPAEQLDEIVAALQRRGFWYSPEFGEAGDHGVSHPEWGTSFFSAEWLVRHATPAWKLAAYGVGRNLGNQDVAVLRRC